MAGKLVSDVYERDGGFVAVLHDDDEPLEVSRLYTDRYEAAKCAIEMVQEEFGDKWQDHTNLRLKVVVLYRYYSYQVGYLDDELFLPTIAIGCEQFHIVKETPAGFWIRYKGKKKFVLARGRKRFAYETKELAWNSFLRRKQKWVEHTRRTHILATTTWLYVKDMKTPPEDTINLFNIQEEHENKSRLTTSP